MSEQTNPQNNAKRPKTQRGALTNMSKSKGKKSMNVDKDRDINEDTIMDVESNESD